MGLLNGLPRQVGYGTAGFVAEDSQPWDVTIGDEKFMLAVSPDNPLIRRGAPYRTEQVNFSNEPGETALGFWWQREQSTWHFGADNPTFDGPGSGEPNVAVGRFASSYGVDPWTPGQVGLCDDTTLLTSAGTAGTNIATFANVVIGSTEYVMWTDSRQYLFMWDGSATPASWLDGVALGTWGNVPSITSDGSVVWLQSGTDLWGYGDIDNTGLAVTRKLYTGMPAASTGIIRFAKQRLIASYDEVLYEIDHSVTATTAFGSPTPLFTHPKAGWKWTDIAEGPGAIYAAGFLGSYSAVYKFVLDTTTGALPTLTQGILACELPAGEIAWKLLPYLGFVAIGTNTGVRVCTFDVTDIVLAPLTIESTDIITGIAAWGDFLLVNLKDVGEGYAGLAKIDLSTEVEPGRYAWANDMRANTSASSFQGVVATTSGGRVTTLRGRPVFHVRSGGVFTQQNTRRSPYGRLVTGRILFGMSDRKNFLRAAIQGQGQGSASLLTGVDSDSAPLTQASINFNQLNSVEVLLSGLTGNTLTLGLTLTRDPVNTNSGPTVNSVSAKALPAQSREEQWILPLRCYDRVEARNGETAYGSARESIDAIRELVRTQAPVLMQTFFGDPTRDWTSTLVHVEDCDYRQTTYDPDAAWGGVLTISVRTIGG